MAIRKSVEEIIKERETNKSLITVVSNKPRRKSVEEIIKERGYIEPKSEPKYSWRDNINKMSGAGTWDKPSAKDIPVTDTGKQQHRGSGGREGGMWKNDPIQAASANIMAGVNQLGRSGANAVNIALGDKNIPIVNKYLDNMKEEARIEDERLAKINQGAVGQIAGGVSKAVGQSIPSTVLALALAPYGIASGVTNLLTKGGVLVNNAAQILNPTTLMMAKNALIELAKNPSTYSSLIQGVGMQFEQAINEGATRAQAIKSALIGGIPSGLIETLGGTENLAGKLASRMPFGRTALESGLSEAFEEVLQYPVENLGQKIAFDKDMPFFSTSETAVINPGEMAMGGLVGGLAGGLMGGGASVVNSALQKKYSKQIDDLYQGVINNLDENSPIMQRVKSMQDNNVNITDETKVWVINSARQQDNNFESETDKILQKNRQKETFVQNENVVNEQILNQEQSFSEAQNNGNRATNPNLSVFSIENIKDPKEVKQNIYNFYKNSIISDSDTSKPITNKNSGENIEISRATINQTFQADDKYAKNQDNEIKIAAMANVVDLIQNGNFEVVDNSKTQSSKIKYAEIKSSVNVNGTLYDISMDVRRTDNGKKLFVHSLSTNNQQTINNSINKKSGVIYSAASEKVRVESPVVYTSLDKIGKAINTKIEFVDTIYDPTGTMPEYANGQFDYSTNTLQIALDASNPFMVVAKHEITHVLQKEAPELYQEYKDYVLGTMQENGTYDNEFNRMAALYKANGLEIDKNGIDDEIVADATELFLTDEASINELANNNPTLGQKILDIIKGFIQKVEKAIGKTSDWMNVEQFRRAQALWVNALNDVANKSQVIGDENDENSVKYSLSGYNVNEIENMILSNHSEYNNNNNKEALKLAGEAIKDLSEVKYSISDKRGEVAGSGIRTIADGISREFINKGYVELKGRKIKSNEEMAVLAQVFRDPRFETFRIFYVKKNKIVAHEGISSRIPGLSSAFLNIPKRSDYASDYDHRMARQDFVNTRFDDMKDRMKRLGADGYYLVHNHPSGEPDASSADMRLTALFNSEVPGLKSHVIINSNKYGVIDINNYKADVFDLSQQMIETFLNPSIPSQYLSNKINGSNAVASMAKAFQSEKNKSMLVFADVKGNVRGIQEIPNGMIKQIESFKGYLRNQGRHFGSGWAFLTTDNSDIFDLTDELIKQRYLMDSVYMDGYFNSSRQDLGTRPSKDYEWAGIKTEELEAIRVNESDLESEHYENEEETFKDYINYKNPDIRYQLKDTADSKDVKILRRTVTRLKEQFKLTKGIKLDEASVRKLSKTLLKDYSSKYSSTELETKLYELYTRNVNDDIEFEEMQTAINNISRDIIENASALNDNMYKEYAEIRKALRNTEISIADKYKGDFNAVGGWNTFRKRNIGRMHLTKEGTDIDVLYQELSEQHPELFLKDIANPADRLMLIEEVLDGLRPIYENPFNRDMNEAIEYLSLEIFDRMTSIPEAKQTFADRKKAEKDKAVNTEREKRRTQIADIRAKNKEDIAWLKYQNKEKIKQVLEKEKVKRDNAIEKLKSKYKGEAYVTWWKNKLNENDIKSHYQEMLKDLRTQRDEKLDQQASRYKERVSGIYEDRKVRQAKESIARRTKRLDAMLRKPTQKKHIPKALEKTIAELLTMLDFTTDKQKENTVLRLRDLKAEYEKIAKVSDEEGLSATADPYITEGLEMLHEKRIVDMSLDEIEILYNIVSYFEYMVNSYNKAFIGGKWEEISKNSYEILDELKTDKPFVESAYNRIQGATDTMKWGMLTPQMFFRRMGKTFTHLYKDIRTSEDKKIIYTKITQDYMSELLKDVDNKTKNSWTGDEAKVKVFKLESGKNIELKPSQVMSLYLLLKREQARGHIFGLGIKASPVVTKYLHKESDGSDKKTLKKRIVRQFEPVKVTVADVQEIIDTLSEKQKKIADGMGKFMNTYTKQWINETTLQNFGYELAKEENYFPIRSDDDFIKSDFDVSNFEASFKSMPFTKSIIKNAGNAIIIDDIFDTFVNHADNAATYSAFLTSVENMKKVINYKTQETSIILAMRKKFGSQAVNYLKKLMRDIQGGIRVEPSVGLISDLVRWRKRAVLGLNPRVVLQQPASIIRASAMIDIEYLAKGIVQKGNMEEMLKHSPIAWWKSQGYFDIDTGRTMKDVILGNKSILDNQYNAIQKADDITWTKIWNAVKLEIEDTESSLKVGSEEYFEAVSDRFSEIIDETQVVDTVLHRSDIMRRREWTWKMTTNFMSEQTKQYNLLLYAAENFKNDPTSSNAKKASRVIVSSIASTLTVTFVASLVDAFRDKDDEEFMKIWFDNAISDPIGMIPVVREFDSIFLFGNKRMEYEALVRFGNALKKFNDWVNEWIEGKKHKHPIRLIVKDVLINGAEIPGVSARNVEKYVEAVMRRYMEWSGDDRGAVSDIYEFMFKK